MRIFVLSLLLIACTRPAPTVLDAGPRPPIARRTPVTTTLHGDTRIDEYAWMKAYSPYDNVSAQAYPSMLVRSAYNDTQVLFHEPAGHGGRTALADVTRDDAKSLTWLLAQWGISQ